MSPKPLENLQSPMVTNAVGLLPVAGGGSGGASTSTVGAQQQQDGVTRGGSISLAMLFDLIIQRTYHELTTLAEILPSKSDMERKVEIYNFSARTRQLFIRLLALVKWANSASKVDKSANIMSFLDKQSMLFIDTADMLARMARETLVHARLPNFHIQAAVEVLTTGNYARLPACIKEKIIPAESITVAEKKSTLQRLNQVIQHRLVSGEVMPQMRKFKIDTGRVTFRIEHEFEVSLTLMGDGPNVPWRLLDIEILVEDKDTGCGKALVHQLQVNYIQQVLQARLVDNSNALEEVYNCLHYFCQSLQLEVLFTQTLKLKVDRLDDDITVDEYVPGEKLTVAYWRALSTKDPARNPTAAIAPDFGFRLTVQTDPNNKARPLAVVHLPSIGAKESAEVADRAVRSDVISMERLLVHTIYIRSMSRLADVKAEFQTFLKDVDYHLQGTPAYLTVPVLHPCLRAEQIHITVDTHTGRLRCHVPKHLDCPVIGELERSLNDDHTRLPALVSELRYWITLRRCEKTLQHLPASPHDRLPLLHAVDHPIARIGKHKLFVRFNRHPTVILVVEIKERPTNACEMDFNFNLVYVRHSSIDDSPNAEENSESDIPKVYLRVQTLIEFDTFVATHGPGTCVDSDMPSAHTSGVAGGKRKLTESAAGPPAKQPKNPSYFIPELAHIVNMCDEKLPFVCLAQELENRGIPHSGLQIEANASALVLKLLALPQPSLASATTTATAAAAGITSSSSSSGTQQSTTGSPESQLHKPTPPGAASMPVISKRVWDSLMRRLLTVAIRAHPGVWTSEIFWSVEFVFNGAPLRSTHSREQGVRRAVTSTLPGNNPTDQIGKTVDCLLDDWKRIVYLYVLVEEFVEQYRAEKLNLQQHICIKSYNYTSLLIGYGRNKEVTVKIFWCIESSRFRMVFTGGNSAVNAHSVMREQLQAHLNSAHNLAQTVHILHETYEPLAAVAKLSVIPHLGIPRPQIPVLSFCIIPQSTTTVKVVYQIMYCLEICFRGGGLVSIRDGAHSRFAKRNVLDEFTPTQGLQSFLSKYVDETTVYRRRSPYEDDNPPSPAVVIEESHGGPGSVGSSFLGSMRGPQSPRDAGGLRFAPPLTPPTISNPLTPASPHHSQQQQQQQQQQNSHSNNFGMTSPPSMPHPSPGAGLMPASPLNPLPSPMAAQSPGPNNLNYMQNHPDSSPFSVMSPATNAGSNWPGSPVMPRPSPRPGQSPEHKVSQQQIPHVSRVLPARSWAGATPTLLTDEALETLCRPGPHPQKDIPGPDMCPLERFLGCCFMRRHLQRFIQGDEFVTAIHCDQLGVVLFKTDSLNCQVFLNPQHHQSLHLKLTQLPPDQQKPVPSTFQWNPDDLHIIERFFDSRVVMPPYRNGALWAFGRLLTVPPPVLRDFIQIMRLELMPEMLPGVKWHVQFCMRSPPSAVPVVPAAVVMVRQKILFFLQITRIPYLPGMEWKDCVSLVLPMVFDVSSNITQLAERRETGGFTQSMSTAAVSNMLRRFAEYSAHQNNECSIFPAVRDLLMNLTLPNEPQPPPQSVHQQQQQQMQNQIIPSPAAIASPSPMMHSPMNQQQIVGPPQGYGGGVGGMGIGQVGGGAGQVGPN